MMTRRPDRFMRSTASRADGLILSAIAITPASLPSIAIRTGVRASALSFSSAGRARVVSMSLSVSKRSLPPALPRCQRVRARATGGRLELQRLRRAESALARVLRDGFSERMLRLPLTRPHWRSSSAGHSGSSGTTSVALGLPSVTVPVCPAPPCQPHANARALRHP
jgi:hypothetical protein